MMFHERRSGDVIADKADETDRSEESENSRPTSPFERLPLEVEEVEVVVPKGLSIIFEELDPKKHFS